MRGRHLCSGNNGQYLQPSGMVWTAPNSFDQDRACSNLCGGRIMKNAVSSRVGFAIRTNFIFLPKSSKLPILFNCCVYKVSRFLG